MELNDESPEDWIETSHDRVYYRSHDDMYFEGEHTVAILVANHLPDWKVVITMGQDRDHQSYHHVMSDKRVIHLDFATDDMVTQILSRPHENSKLIKQIIGIIIKDAKEAIEL